MREKCARVLVAALMTGAIGFALAMPAIFGTTHNAGRSVTAPPSSLQRSVHVVASAPLRSARGGRLEETQPIRPASLLQAGRSGSPRNGSTPASSRHSTRAGRSERSPKPAPKPTPASTTRELASTTTPAAVSSPAPSQPAATPDSKGKGKKSKRHDNKGKPKDVSQPPVAATTPQPANASPVTEDGNDHGNDKGKNKGKGDDKGHDG